MGTSKNEWINMTIRSENMKITIDNAEESIIKTVKPSGNGGYVYIPSKWIGREVQIILLKKDDKMDKESFELKIVDENYEISIIAEFDEDNEFVYFQNPLTGNMVESLSHVFSNWSEQNETDEENRQNFIQKVESFFDDDMSMHWIYDFCTSSASEWKLDQYSLKLQK